MTWVVYGIKCQGDDKYRYVGKTTWEASQRLQRHLSDARRMVNTRRITNWLNSVDHSTVIIVPLEHCPKGDKEYLNYAEKYWIAELKALGHDLVNHTIGGDGTSGYSHSEVAKKRLSESRIASGVARGENNPRFGVRGELHPLFGLKGEAHPGFGYKDTPERIEQKRVFATGRTHSAEVRARISAAHKGKPKSEETKLKLKKAQHLNHHEKRDIINERCCFCIPATVSE